MATNKRFHCGLFLLIIAFLILPVQGTAQTTRPATFEEHKITWDGHERSFWLYKPADEVLKTPAPVVFVLHGGGGAAQNMPAFINYGFAKLANEDGFLVVYPQGLGSSWNDGRDPKVYPSISNQIAWRDNIDDVGFLVETLNALENLGFTIDREKTFACGNSNGGFMSNRLICDRPDVFRGAGVITATMDVTYASECNPSHPVGLVVMNGTEDKSIPYDGGDLIVFYAKRGEILSTEKYVDFWAKHNKCKTKEPVVSIPDKDKDGTSVQLYEYTGGKDGTRILLYKIEGGGHTWPGARAPFYELIAGKPCMEINACEILWDFFQSL